MATATRPARINAQADAGGPHRNAFGVSGRRDHFGRRRFARSQRGGQRIAAGERSCDRQRRRRTILRVRFQAAEDHALDGRVHVLHQRGGRGGGIVAALAGEHFVQHQAQRVDVAADGDLSSRRPAPEPCTRACLREPARSRPASPANPKSVISTWPRPSSMMLAGFRSRCSTPLSWAAARPAHSRRAISSALSPGRRPMRRSSERRSSPSTYSIERNVDAVHFADVVHAAHIRMRDLPGDAHLGVEPVQQIARGRRGQKLERHGLVQLQIVGAIDLAHPALADESQNAVAFGEDGADRKAAFIDGAARGCRRPLARHRDGGRLGIGRRERRAASAAKSLPHGHFRGARRAPGHPISIRAYSRLFAAGP